MKYCNVCVYPASTVLLDIDEEGICSSCRTFEKFEKLSDVDWEPRRLKFDQIVEQMKSESKGSNYDCLIPVSGGKDSYYQTDVMTREYGLKPLLMTYHGNNFLPEGDYNRDRMRENFDADHIVWGPSVEVLKKLNRIGFKKMGDMNWHNHCGIWTAPIRVAVNFKIPLIIWGEIAWDISGMYQPNDFVEFSARSRHEHALRGFEWDDFLDDAEDPLTENDMLWAKYPSDEEILDVGVRGLYIGNYVKWDPNKHSKDMIERYGWKQAEAAFERTYRTISNIDDRYENGIHDLLKFIKFGYGRCSDHAGKDIRTGYMSRAEGIEMVRKYDHVVSSDLEYWLNYVDMNEGEFWAIADTFRDPRVWWIKDNRWWKDTLWGEPAEYGEVRLSEKQKKDFEARRGKINFA